MLNRHRRDRLAARLAAPQVMPRQEALAMMGLQDPFDPEALKARYRELSRQHHPDRGGDAQTMARLNNAYEALSSPSRAERAEQPQRDHYSEADKAQFKQRIIALQYRQVLYNEILSQVPFDFMFDGNFEARPIGSKRQTKRLSDNELESLLDRVLNADRAIPGTVLLGMAINENWKEGWVTFQLSRQDGRKLYQSIRFAAVPTKAPKVKSLSREELLGQLQQAGLQLIGGGSRNLYYGVQGQSRAIKLQPRNVVLVRRSQGVEIKLTSIPYGQLTAERLQQMIQAALGRQASFAGLRKLIVFLGSPENRYLGKSDNPETIYIDPTGKKIRISIGDWQENFGPDRQQASKTALERLGFEVELCDECGKPEGWDRVNRMANFKHPADIPVEVAMAIYRIMHNSAAAQDWELLDRQDPKILIGWLRGLLTANGVQDVERELLWWRKELYGPQTN